MSSFMKSGFPGRFPLIPKDLCIYNTYISMNYAFKRNIETRAICFTFTSKEYAINRQQI